MRTRIYGTRTSAPVYDGTFRRTSGRSAQASATACPSNASSLPMRESLRRPYRVRNVGLCSKESTALGSRFPDDSRRVWLGLRRLLLLLKGRASLSDFIYTVA